MKNISNINIYEKIFYLYFYQVKKYWLVYFLLSYFVIQSNTKSFTINKRESVITESSTVSLVRSRRDGGFGNFKIFSRNDLYNFRSMVEQTGNVFLIIFLMILFKLLVVFVISVYLWLTQQEGPEGRPGSSAIKVYLNHEINNHI